MIVERTLEYIKYIKEAKNEKSNKKSNDLSTKCDDNDFIRSVNDKCEAYILDSGQCSVRSCDDLIDKTKNNKSFDGTEKAKLSLNIRGSGNKNIEAEIIEEKSSMHVKSIKEDIENEPNLGINKDKEHTKTQKDIRFSNEEKRKTDNIYYEKENISNIFIENKPYNDIYESKEAEKKIAKKQTISDSMSYCSSQTATDTESLSEDTYFNFKNLSLNYNEDLNEKYHDLVFHNLKSKLFQCKQILKSLKSNIKKYQIGFNKKRNKMAIINSEKTELNLSIVQVENFMSDINLSKEYPEMMVRNVLRHYGQILRFILVEYRNVEEKFLERYNDSFAGYDENNNYSEYSNYNDYDNEDNYSLKSKTFPDQNVNNTMQLSKDKLNEAERVRKGIFFITTLLLELKMICRSHTSKIDRIETYFNETNNNLEKTNEIIASVPEKHNRIKNKIIYILCFFIIVLMFLCTVKNMKRKNRI